MNTNELILKPCPFCGGEAKIIECNVYLDEARRVRCTHCGVTTPPVLVDHPAYTADSFPYLDESTRYTAEQASEKVAEQWNRRVRENDKKQIEEKELKDQIAQLKRERDAAISDLMLMRSGEYSVGFTDQQRFTAVEYYKGLSCVFCKKFKHFDRPLPEDHLQTCWGGNCKFEWRGLLVPEPPKGE